MMRSRSSSSKSELVLAALLVGGCSPCDSDHEKLTLALAEPGGAAFSFRGHGKDDALSGRAELQGFASQAGDQPCRVALYRSDAEPIRAEVPTLTQHEPPPASFGTDAVLVFDTILLPPLDGRTLSRAVRADDGAQILLDEARDGDVALSLIIATCDRPEVTLALQISSEFCATSSDRHPDLEVERVW